MWTGKHRETDRVTTPAEAEFVLVDPAKGTPVPAFDHARLAATLSKAANATYEPSTLPFNEIDLTPDAQFVSFNATGRRWKCDVKGTECADEGVARGAVGHPPSDQHAAD